MDFKLMLFIRFNVGCRRLPLPCVKICMVKYMRGNNMIWLGLVSREIEIDHRFRCLIL